ncbi:hypothetical protein [Streptomyces sp. NPDC001770]
MNIRSRYRGRIASVGEREALAYLALHRRLKVPEPASIRPMR